MVLLLFPKYMSSKFSGFLVALKSEMPYLGHFQRFAIIRVRPLLSGIHSQMLYFIAFEVMTLYSINSFVYVFQFL
jgi:hypothetical protein